MNDVEISNYNDAIELMVFVHKFLFKIIKTSYTVNFELINAFDNLEYSLWFAKNIGEEVPICSKCGGIYYQRLETRNIQCLDCDYIWKWDYEHENNDEGLKTTTPKIDFSIGLDSLDGALYVLSKHHDRNATTSTSYLEKTIEYLTRQSYQDQNARYSENVS